MSDNERTGAFWDRHNERMKDLEFAARFDAEIARIERAHDMTLAIRRQKLILLAALAIFVLVAVVLTWAWTIYGTWYLLFVASLGIAGTLAVIRDLWRLR